MHFGRIGERPQAGPPPQYIWDRRTQGPRVPMLCLGGIVSRAFGNRCPLAFMEQIVITVALIRHSVVAPGIIMISVQPCAPSPPRLSRRLPTDVTADQIERALEGNASGGTGRSKRRSEILRAGVDRAHELVFGSSRHAGTCSSDRFVPVAQLPRRGVAARDRSRLMIVGENASGVCCHHV